MIKIIFLLTIAFIAILGQRLCESSMYESFIPKLDVGMAINQRNSADIEIRNDRWASVIVVIDKNSTTKSTSATFNEHYITRFSGMDVQKAQDQLKQNDSDGFATTVSSPGVQSVCIISYSDKSKYLKNGQIVDLSETDYKSVPLFIVSIEHEISHCSTPTWILKQAQSHTTSSLPQVSELFADLNALAKLNDKKYLDAILEFRVLAKKYDTVGYYSLNVQGIKTLPQYLSSPTSKNPIEFMKSYVNNELVKKKAP